MVMYLCGCGGDALGVLLSTLLRSKWFFFGFFFNYSSGRSQKVKPLPVTRSSDMVDVVVDSAETTFCLQTSKKQHPCVFCVSEQSTPRILTLTSRYVSNSSTIA